MNKKIWEKFKDVFSYDAERFGRYMYDKGEVLECTEGNGTFRAIVKHDSKAYNVTINDELNCDCHLDEENCIHEYAVLLAIKAGEYVSLPLMPEVSKKKFDAKSIIKAIPAKDLKEYFILNGLDINIKDFKNYFRKYMPKQDYEYYYNNLYNSIVSDENYNKLTNSYLKEVKRYIDSGEFSEAYKVMRSVILVYADMDRINEKNIVDKFPTIGMYLRIIYRKSDDSVKAAMDEFTDLLKSKDYYGSLYLEDAILSK